jgi:hypothetical protein
MATGSAPLEFRVKVVLYERRFPLCGENRVKLRRAYDNSDDDENAGTRRQLQPLVRRRGVHNTATAPQQ